MKGSFGVVVLVVLVAIGCSPSTGEPVTMLPAAAPSAATGTVDSIARLRERLSTNRDDPVALRDLGLTLLQRVRETADPSLYGQAEEALTEALDLAADDPMVLVGIGGLQLGRHQFADALDTADAAIELAPSLAPAHAIRVDALVELGRYGEATDAAGALLALRVDLTSLARVSYLRELHGNIPGAVAAMRQAAASPALAPENTAYVQTLLGNLLVYSGRPDEAADAYNAALKTVPNHAPAISGLGRLAVGRGDLVEAIGRFEQASAILPLPEYVIALGEARDASGDEEGARTAYDLARAETQLFVAAGVDVDLELALFEADHGDPERAVDLARAAYATRQTVRTADVLAWASHRAGRDAEASRLSADALRLGTNDPLLLYHAGMIAASGGDIVVAHDRLAAALALDPGFSATAVPLARAALSAT